MNRIRRVPLLLCALLLALNVWLVLGHREDSEGDTPQPPLQQSSSVSGVKAGAEVAAPPVTPPADPLSWKGWQSARTKEEVRLLAAAADSAEAIGTVPAESLCAVTAREEDWAYVCSRTLAGWVRYSSLSPVGELYQAREKTPLPEPVSLSEEQGAPIKEIAERNKIVGMTLALIEGGRVKYTYEYGFADVAANKPMTADTKIRIASISKVFTGMNAVAARDLGAMTLEDDIGGILGYTVRNPKHKDTPITPYMLMTHTSSMYDIGYEKGIQEGLTADSTYEGKVPGSEEAWRYNNFAAGVLGAVTEKALDMTLLDFSKRYFLDRMGIDAGYHAKQLAARDKIATLYSGQSVYRSVDEQLSRSYPQTPGGSYAPYFGALTISAKDMASVITILINDGEYNGEYYLSPASVEEIQQPRLHMDNFDQCYILRRQEDMYDGRTLFYHTGNAQGVLSFASYEEQSGDGLVIITTGRQNENRDEKGIYSVCGDIADHCYKNILGVQ